MRGGGGWGEIQFLRASRRDRWRNGGLYQERRNDNCSLTYTKYKQNMHSITHSVRSHSGLVYMCGSSSFASDPLSARTATIVGLWESLDQGSVN